MRVFTVFILLVGLTTAMPTETLLLGLNASDSTEWAESTELEESSPDYLINPDKRIVGGFMAHIKNHKHLVQLRYLKSWICGGSLVSRKHVVTAAHCVDFAPGKPKAFSIKAGRTLVNKPGPTSAVMKISMHPKYNKKTANFDIAVLKLVKIMKGDMIAPIVLATIQLKEGQFAKVSGWGLTKENGYSSNSLRATFVPSVSKAVCKKAYGTNAITESMICAGGNSKDACQGDSGGPLTYAGKLIGVVSWGLGCARNGYPGVYTSVVTCTTFIKNNLK